MEKPARLGGVELWKIPDVYQVMEKDTQKTIPELSQRTRSDNPDQIYHGTVQNFTFTCKNEMD